MGRAALAGIALGLMLAIVAAPKPVNLHETGSWYHTGPNAVVVRLHTDNLPIRIPLGGPMVVRGVVDPVEYHY